MRQRWILSAIVIACFISSGYCIAQKPETSNAGVSPFQSYNVQDTYNIDLATGQINGQIILASYPQLGKLKPLTYYIELNSPSFSKNESCGANTCFVYYDLGLAPYGAQLNTNYQAITVIRKEPTAQVDDFGYTHIEISYSLQDPTGHIHSLLQDTSHQNVLRSLDGSGYTVVFPDGSNLYDQSSGSLADVTTAAVYDDSGIKYAGFGSVNGGFSYSSVSANDTNNNSITYTIDNTEIVDSIKRHLPYVPNSIYGYPDVGSRDVSKCPSLGDPNQPALGSYTLNLLGVGDATMPILLCYSGFYYRTDLPNAFDPAQFYGNDNPPPDPGGTVLQNTFGGMSAIQSIVFPDGKYYGFLYDASAVVWNSNQSEVISATPAYGAIRKIIYPTGASASFEPMRPLVGVGLPFSVSMNGGPYFTTYYPRIETETRDDGNGTVEARTYQGGPYDTVQYSNKFTVDETDLNNNVTRHTFTDLTGTENFLQVYETQTDYYQGVATGTPLKTIHKSYQYQPAILGYLEGINSVAMTLPLTVQTDLNGETRSIETYSYPAQNIVERIGCSGIPPDYMSCDPFSNTPGMPTPATVNVYGSTPLEVTTTDAAGNLLRKIVNTPYFSQNNLYKDKNLFDLPGATEIYDSQNHLAAKTEYFYDEAGSPQGIIGNQTSINRWLNTTGINLISAISFNSEGMPLLATDPNGNHTAFQNYQCNGLYPTTIIYAYQSQDTIPESTTVSRDCNTGQLLSSTDSNGIQTVYIYSDPLFRLTEIDSAVGTTKESSTVISYPSRVEMDTAADKDVKGDGAIKAATIKDGFGRVIHQISPSGATVDTSYDSTGHIQSISNPHYAAPSPTDGATIFKYDALGRTTLKCNPDNGTGIPCSAGNSYQEWSYSGNTVQHNDERRNLWQTISDPLGRLSNVTEPGSLQTSYSYDALDNLASITQSGLVGEEPRPRSFFFDSLSRLVAMKNLEQGDGLTCAGSPVGTTWSVCYSYDANGNVRTRTDSRNLVTSYYYDALNRITSKTYSGETNPDGTPSTHPTPASCYSYDIGFDSGANAIGRLTGEWTQSGSCTRTGVQSIPSAATSWKKGMAYNPTGRLTDEIQCPVAPCSAPNPMHYDYDLAGETAHQGNGLSNSQSPQIGWTNSYDAAGHLIKIQSDWSDTSGHPATLFNAQDSNGVSTYGPFGLTAAQFGIPESSTTAALTETMSYDNRGRILRKEFTGPAQAGTTSTISFNPNTISFTLADQPFVPIQVSCNSACGQVQFLIDGNNWSIPQTLNGDGRFRAYGLPTNLALGGHYIQAQYLGNSAFTPSLSNRIDFTLLAIGTTPSSIQVSLNPNTSTFTLNDQPVAPVQVSCNSACGWVQFLIDGSNWSGPQQLDNNGRFQGYGFPTNLTKNQQHYIQVKYLGNSTYAASISAQILFTLVDPGSTPTTITATLDPPLVGFRGSDLGSVKVPTQVGCNSACGKVSFTIDGIAWSDPTGYNLDSTGKFRAYAFPPLSLGQHEIRAYYLGNPTYAPIESAPVILTVLPDSELPTSTTVSLSPVKSTFTLVDQPIYPVQVSCNTNCGSVQFSIDDVNWTIPQTLNSNGQVNGHDIPLDTSPGLHFMRVQYLGNQTYAPSISAKLPFTLAQIGTTVTSISVSLSPVKITYSQADLSSTTVPVQVGCNSACGKLQFYIDNNLWSGPQTLNSTGYFAGYGFPPLSLGVHHISVQYLGNATYAPISGAVDITVAN